MIKQCHVCGKEKEHKSWKSTTCDTCLASGVKYCSDCNTVQPLSNYQLCRGKPIGRCRRCENTRSYQGKINRGYLDRPDVREKLNDSSRINKQKVCKDPIRLRAIYDRHNERLRERYATSINYRQKRLNSITVRRAKESYAGKCTGDDWQDALDFFENSCAYCGVTEKLYQDHVVTISKEGKNNISNIVPACLRCNSSKHNKDMEVWYRTREYFSESRLKDIRAYMEVMTCSR